jgi:hypothetical protein
MKIVSAEEMLMRWQGKPLEEMTQKELINVIGQLMAGYRYEFDLRQREREIMSKFRNVRRQ